MKVPQSLISNCMSFTILEITCMIIRKASPRCQSVAWQAPSIVFWNSSVPMVYRSLQTESRRVGFMMCAYCNNDSHLCLKTTVGSFVSDAVKLTSECRTCDLWGSMYMRSSGCNIGMSEAVENLLCMVYRSCHIR